MKFKIEHVAIGTRDIPRNLDPLLLSFGDYVETAIEYNNEYLLSKYIPKKSKIISRIHDAENFDYLLVNHLKYLKRDYVDIMLLDQAMLPEKSTYDFLYNNYCSSIGLSGNITIDSIEEYKNKFGIYPEYISIPLNPFNFRKNLIDKCREENIKIISYEIFGGPIEARKMLNTFGLQFLTRFASYYSDIVCMSSSANLEEEMILSKTLLDLCEDKDISDDTIYELNKDSIISGYGAQRKVFTYSEVSISGKNHIFKNNYNGYITPNELIISYDKSLEYIPILNIEELKESDNIFEETLFVMSSIREVDPPKSKEEISAFYRYIVMDTILNLYNDKRYKIKLDKIGNIFRISIYDRIKFWKKSIEYILYVSERPDGGYNVFFRNL